MSNALIITAHGNFSSGIESAIKLIAGPMSNLRIVDFVEGDTYEIIDEKLKKAFEDLKDYTNVLFLTDLTGGTPFNRSVMLFSDKENVRVLSGLNFASAFTALMSTEDNIENLIKEVIDAGHESINFYQPPTKTVEMEDDGI